MSDAAPSANGAQPYAGFRLLAVHAHPDDESSKGAGTVARYGAMGADTLIATLTGGEGGDILNPAMLASPKAARDLAGLRREEMANAARIMGAEHRWVGYVDGGMPTIDGELPPEEAFNELLPSGCFYRVPVGVAMRPLVQIIRTFRPQVVTTYDEIGGYPHPDHIQTHRVTMAAVDAAAEASVNPELGAAWRVSKVYYNQDFNLEKFRTIDAGLRASGKESPLGEMIERFETRGPRRDSWLSTSVNVAPWFDARSRALKAHATQIDPNGGFFSLDSGEAAQWWPTEEYELAIDRTGRPEMPRKNFVEDDLFADVEGDHGALDRAAVKRWMDSQG